MRIVIGLLVSASLVSSAVAGEPASEGAATERLMLSGIGPRDAVPWDFTIDGGRRAGEKARIPVPSNWQQQGFGLYQYGYDKVRQPSARGTYRRRFMVPADWKEKNVRIVFDGVMTDAFVRVNGRPAGELHCGGFNRFSYDVTALVRAGMDNEIEVVVDEASAAPDVDVAERHGDYWVFGGIYRPVWLEAAPAQAIGQVAVDARADGGFAADVTLQSPRTVTAVRAQVLDGAGATVGLPATASITAGGAGRVRVSGRIDAPRLWTAETPNLYTLRITLLDGDKAVHRVERRIGFRTFEVRDGDGLYLNGRRILLKGVNRHSFRPDTGRALDRTDAYDDVRTIRALNMNAVRMSHYAPEEGFLEAADELGLYVIDELTGWQKAYGTETGRKLVRELVERDVNHPSILLWTNGNEGGWNRALDADFALYDPQQRRVLHPWELFGGIDTKHYPRFPDLQRRLAGPALVMPTEFLHGLFDGGGGAGLDDYWHAITASPRGAGGFLWNLNDEGVARSDQGGRIDLYGSFAPDGILGARGEREPSANTVRKIWSPIQIDEPASWSRLGQGLTVRNGYDFTSLSQATFRWQWLGFGDGTAERVLGTGQRSGLTIAPQAAGLLRVPSRDDADALRITATLGGREVSSWTWRREQLAMVAPGRALGRPTARRDGDDIILSAGAVDAVIDARTGMLRSLSNGRRRLALSEGGLQVGRPAGEQSPVWMHTTSGASGIYKLPSAIRADVARVDLGLTEADGWAGFAMEVSVDGTVWRKVYQGERVQRDGDTYAFPSQLVRYLRISALKGVRTTPRVRGVEVSGTSARFAVHDRPVAPSIGGGRDTETGRAMAWVDAGGAGGLKQARWTLRDDGALTLDYGYDLTGPMLYHGIGFDLPEGTVRAAAGLLQGPDPVWQNRTRGPEFGSHRIAGTGTRLSPDAAGYFADPQRLTLQMDKGTLMIETRGAPFLQLGARPVDHPTTSAAFPATRLGFMQAIPAMGAKGQGADLTGPAGQPAIAAGHYAGRVRFRW